MECHTDSQSDCENCLLCAASNKAHSWRNSGRDFLNRVRQKGKTGVECVLRGISERSERYEKAYPKTYGILVNSGHKVLSVLHIVLEILKKVYVRGVSGAKSAYANMMSHCPSAQEMKRFLISNRKILYFCGSAMVTTGIYLFILPMFDSKFYYYSSILFICSIFLMFAGGFITWLPAFYLWDTSRHQNLLDDSISQSQFMDKPPVYESLPPGFSPLPTLEDEPPPTYEEISASNQGLLQTGDCGFGPVPPYDLHQPAENRLTHDDQNVIDTVVLLPVETSEPIVTSSHAIQESTSAVHP